MNFKRIQRRRFLKTVLVGATAASVRDGVAQEPAGADFEISLNERSFTHAIAQGTISHLDLARVAKNEVGVTAIEYASSFFLGKRHDSKYLDSMNSRAADFGVRQLLIMVEDATRLCDPDAIKQRDAIGSHRQWIDAAKALGCHSIQVNPTSSGNASEQQKRAVDALQALCEYGALRKIYVLLGNYGGVSANANWIVDVVNAVKSPICGTLPQIGKSATNQDYESLAAIVPLAKGVTAQTFAFDEQGHEKHTDFVRAMQVVRQAGYRGYVGIHFAGNQSDTLAGVRATKLLLEKLRGKVIENGGGYR